MNSSASTVPRGDTAVAAPTAARLFAHAATGCGLPSDRAAAGAAQHTLQALQRSFLHVLADVPAAERLRGAVEEAASAQALWALRAPVFAHLVGTEPTQRWRRQLLHRSLDSVFG